MLARGRPEAGSTANPDREVSRDPHVVSTAAAGVHLSVALGPFYDVPKIPKWRLQ